MLSISIAAVLCALTVAACLFWGLHPLIAFERGLCVFMGSLLGSLINDALKEGD